MKPTLQELIDNYECVLLRLSDGDLAGIVKDCRFKDLQVVRKSKWITRDQYVIDLDVGYKRQSFRGLYDIDAIAFLSNKSEVSDAIEFGCDEDIDWDWDINNPRNLKVKIGDNE